MLDSRKFLLFCMGIDGDESKPIIPLLFPYYSPIIPILLFPYYPPIIPILFPYSHPYYSHIIAILGGINIHSPAMT